MPELITLRVCDSPSVPPEQVTVTIPVTVSLWSCAAVRSRVVTALVTVAASVVRPDPPPPPPPVMLIVEIPETGAVIVETPAPLKSRKVTPNPTVPPAVLMPTPAITPERFDPSP